MGDIKSYRFGMVIYLFEVKEIVYQEPPEVFGLTKMTQACYLPEPGSVACYLHRSNCLSLEAYNEGPDIWFPTDGCRNPDAMELIVYSRLNLV